MHWLVLGVSGGQSGLQLSHQSCRDSLAARQVMMNKSKTAGGEDQESLKRGGGGEGEEEGREGRRGETGQQEQLMKGLRALKVSFQSLASERLSQSCLQATSSQQNTLLEPEIGGTWTLGW